MQTIITAPETLRYRVDDAGVSQFPTLPGVDPTDARLAAEYVAHAYEQAVVDRYRPAPDPLAFAAYGRAVYIARKLEPDWSAYDVNRLAYAILWQAGRQPHAAIEPDFEGLDDDERAEQLLREHDLAWKVRQGMRSNPEAQLGAIRVILAHMDGETRDDVEAAIETYAPACARALADVGIAELAEDYAPTCIACTRPATVGKRCDTCSAREREKSRKRDAKRRAAKAAAAGDALAAAIEGHPDLA